jgi:hypothetical protein
MFVAEADKHHLAVVASEFSRFIGQHNLSMLDFLGELDMTGRTTSIGLAKRMWCLRIPS